MLFSGVSIAQSYDAIFVSAKSLLPKVDNPNLIILHVDAPSLYEKGHITGAIQISSDDFTTRNQDIYFEIPDAGSFSKLLAQKGITEDSQIVICSGWDSFEPAYRLYYTLDYYGLAEQTKVLDGGIRNWYESGYKLSTEDVSATIGKELVLDADESKLATKDWVLKNLENPEIKLVDARIDAYYSGKSGSYERGGHIKGAVRVTWLDLVNDNHTVKSQNELRDLFEDAGVKMNTTMTSYCHIGLRATVVYTLAKSLGYDVKMYDGSMNEWSQLSDEYPTVRGN